LSGIIERTLSKKIVVCIPAYNEADRIAEIVNRCLEYATKVIVYDDGSSDNTQEVAMRAGASVIKGVNNRGYGVAIRTLFQLAKEEDVDVMITLDADGQHDPGQINKIIEPVLDQGVDLVIGSRFLNRQDSERVPKYRSFGIKTITRLTQVASYRNITDAQSGFRAYSKRAISKINLYEQGMGVSTEILMRAKEKELLIKEVPVTVEYDMKDTSTHNPLSHGMGVLYTVMQFISLRHPLAFYSLPGIVLLIVAAFYMNNAMELYSATKYISTNMILVSVGTAVVGVVLFATGVILYTLTALLRGRIKEI
jgi:glycosyltransferase involved in cell wall biosynthesis